MTEDQRKTVERLIDELTIDTGMSALKRDGRSLRHVDERDAMYFRLGILANETNGLSLARIEVDGTVLHGPPEALADELAGKVREAQRAYASALRAAADRMDPK